MITRPGFRALRTLSVGALCLGLPAAPFQPRAQAAGGAPAASADSPLAWQVYRVFETHCVECHGGHLTRPKGKFGYVLDLRRLVTEKKVVPGDPEGADLFYMLRSVDPEEKMPPPDSDLEPLTTAQIETIRQWIAAGAQVDVTAGTDPPERHAEPAREQASFGAARFIGRLHPLLVHFPIALLVCAFAAGLGARLAPARTWLAGMARGCLWVGALAAPLAAACGWLNARFEGYAAGTVETHRWLGVSTAAVALLALLALEFSLRRRTASGPWRMLALLLLAAAAILVGLAGHTGGLLAYGADYFGQGL